MEDYLHYLSKYLLRYGLFLWLGFSLGLAHVTISNPSFWVIVLGCAGIDQVQIYFREK